MISFHAKVVDLLDVPVSCLTTPQENLTQSQKEQLSMATAGARALWSLSESRHNKEIMRRSGVIPLMARLLQSIHIETVVPIMGCVQQCASQVFPFTLLFSSFYFYIYKLRC